MAYQLRRSDNAGVPSDAIKSPDDDYYVAVNDSEAENAFGLAVQEPDGDVKAWFPWGGEEVYKKGDDFSFLVKDPEYSYSWVLVYKFLKNRKQCQPLAVKNDSGDDIVPASFAGRLGKINLESMDGMTTFADKECVRTPEEVQQAKILCVRRKHQDCHVEYEATSQGAYPPADCVRAKQCKYKSFVALSNAFDPPQFGRASLNHSHDGLQAWFPYDGEEHEKEDFLLVRVGECACLYWAPIREVNEDPNRHELVKYGTQSPAVLGGLLGKAHVEQLEGWVSEDGEERVVEKDAVLDGTVLCYKDHACTDH